MAFINEYMSAEDKAKYGIEAINLRYTAGGTDARDWTIDKERGIYLRHVAWGPREPDLFFTELVWTLFWEGELLELGLTKLKSTGGRGQPGWSHWKLRYLSLPSHLEDRREEVIDCLREALAGYKDGGVFGSATEYSVTLDV